jgi:hypothetical protein
MMAATLPLMSRKVSGRTPDSAHSFKRGLHFSQISDGGVECGSLHGMDGANDDGLIKLEGLYTSTSLRRLIKGAVGMPNRSERSMARENTTLDA